MLYFHDIFDSTRLLVKKVFEKFLETKIPSYFSRETWEIRTLENAFEFIWKEIFFDFQG